MKNAVFNFFGSALIPLVHAEIAASTTYNVQLILVCAAAVRAFPNQLTVFVLYTFNLAVKAALLTIITFCVKFGIHDVVVHKLNDAFNSGKVVLQVRNFYIAYATAQRLCLEFCFLCQLVESVYLLCNMDMVRVGYIRLIGNTLYYTEPPLESLSE